MSLGNFTQWAVERAVELVNLFETDAPVTPGQLHVMLANYGFREEDMEVTSFGRLADELRHVLAEPEAATRIERLNEQLERFRPSPQIVDHDELGPHFHYVTGDMPAVEHIGVSFVMAIANAFVDQGADRFGWCAAPSCERLYFDRSRSRTQRYCSRSCATRVHVAAHRARS